MGRIYDDPLRLRVRSGGPQSLPEGGAELRRIFGDDPLFDLASLTYSHKLLKDNRVHGPGVGLEEPGREIELGIRLVEDTFERLCVGVRSGYGFHGGLRGERERLEVVWDRGARYASHQGMAATTYGGLYHAYSALDR
jgi:hypothetical protein